MSCSSAETSSSSRSSYLASLASRSAARWVATACRRKRSGAASQPGMRSKKSKVFARAASASTPAGVIASTAFGTLEILVFLAAFVRFAMRSTAITSETSDSIAATTSPAEVCSSRTSLSTRLRDSASAGKSSSASKAAVRRRPCPSFCRAPGATGRGRSVTGFSAGFNVYVGGRPMAALHPCNPLIGTPRRKVEWGRHPICEGLTCRAGERLVDALECGAAAQQGDRLEDARRDRRPRDGHADRLVELAGLHVELLHQGSEGALDARLVEGLDLSERLACAREVLGGAVLHHLGPRLLVGRLLLVEPAGERLEVGERLHLLLADRDRRLDPTAAGELLERARQLARAHLAQVAAVHPAQLLLVEDGRALRHAVEGEALDQLVGREEGRLVVEAPAEQRQVVANRRRQEALVPQLL